MISTRSYYSPDVAVELCRRSGQGLSLPLPQPQSTLSDSQSDAGDGLHRRLTPPSEIDRKSSGGQARRRIAVACQRCRKRKIKCSGDPGNGQGCTNCRSAGAAPSLCTFLRVNSRECGTYLTTRGAQNPTRYNPYPSNQSLPTKGSSLQLHSGSMATSPYVSMPGGYDCYNGMYGQNITRASYPTYPITYEEDGYSGQSPAYMIPNNSDSMLGTHSFLGPPASPRNWDVISSSGRSHHGMYPDPLPPSSVSMANGSFPGSNIPVGSNTNDISASLSSTGGMNSLDRTLPNPVLGRSQQPGAVMTGVNSLEALPLSHLGYRGCLPWTGSDGLSASSQSSMSMSYGSTVANNSAGSAESSSATSQDAPFAYIPMSHGSMSAPAKSPITLTNPDKSDPANTHHKIEDAATEHRSSRPLSQESTTPSPETNIAETYGYRCDMTLSRRSARASTSHSHNTGTLSNGQEYTRPRPVPTSQTSCEPYRPTEQELAGFHPHLAHRTSIPSLSGSARY